MKNPSTFDDYIQVINEKRNELEELEDACRVAQELVEEIKKCKFQGVVDLQKFIDVEEKYPN